jgi:hypothetical protein
MNCFESRISGGTFLPMRRLFLTILALFTAGALSALSVGLGGTGTVQLGAGQGFDPKLQFGGGGTLAVSFPILGWLDLRTDADFFAVLPSDIAGGYLFRGYVGGALALGADAHAPVAQWKGVGLLDAGGGLSLAGAFVGTTYTSLYWFYPEVRLEGFLDFRPEALKSLHCILYVPLHWELRKDMDSCFSTGIGLRVAYSFLED